MMSKRREFPVVLFMLIPGCVDELDPAGSEPADAVTIAAPNPVSPGRRLAQGLDHPRMLTGDVEVAALVADDSLVLVERLNATSQVLAKGKTGDAVVLTERWVVWNDSHDGALYRAGRRGEKTEMLLAGPWHGVALAADGDTVFAASSNGKIFAIGPEGGEPKPIGTLADPVGAVALSKSDAFVMTKAGELWRFARNGKQPKGDRLAMGESTRDRLVERDGWLYWMTYDGQAVRALAPGAKAPVSLYTFDHAVTDFAVDDARVYVADPQYSRIWYGPRAPGKPLTVFVDGVGNPTELTARGVSVTWLDPNEGAVISFDKDDAQGNGFMVDPSQAGR
jgi:DNA-binding beta-propeller fold protein YncE